MSLMIQAWALVRHLQHPSKKQPMRNLNVRPLSWGKGVKSLKLPTTWELEYRLRLLLNFVIAREILKIASLELLAPHPRVVFLEKFSHLAPKIGYLYVWIQI